jgi:hypothetical protein
MDQDPDVSGADENQAVPQKNNQTDSNDDDEKECLPIAILWNSYKIHSPILSTHGFLLRKYRLIKGE